MAADDAHEVASFIYVKKRHAILKPRILLTAQVFRATNGRALVWGKPPKKITAKYATGSGGQKTSLLLASGEGACLKKCSQIGAQLHHLVQTSRLCFHTLLHQG